MSDIRNLLLDRILNSEFKTEKTKLGSKVISGLICPECGGAGRAWCYRDEPWSVNCNRLNECGARTKTLELFPEVVRNIEKDFPQTPEDPNRPAREYLKSRGINSALVGLEFEYWPNVRKTGSGAVMWPVINGEGQKVHNGRLLNPPKGEGKTHNRGSTTGAFWKHPNIKYDIHKEVFVTEGVLDALSLFEIGHQALAVLASGQDPSNVDLAEYHNLVFAFDNDPAGWRALRKWSGYYPKAGAVMSSKGDWNDFIRTNRRENLAEAFEAQRPELAFNAQLAMCDKPDRYAEVFRAFKGHPAGLFIFGGCYYFDDGKQVSRASNFTVEVIHFQLGLQNPDEPAYKYRLRVRPVRGRSKTFTVSACELSSQQNLTSLFLQRAKLLWEGGRGASMALIRRIVETRAPEIRQLEAIGFDHKSGC